MDCFFESADEKLDFLVNELEDYRHEIRELEMKRPKEKYIHAIRQKRMEAEKVEAQIRITHNQLRFMGTTPPGNR